MAVTVDTGDTSNQRRRVVADKSTARADGRLVRRSTIPTIGASREESLTTADRVRGEQHSRLPSQLQFPSLAHELFSEVLLLLLVNEVKTRLLIDAPGGL